MGRHNLNQVVKVSSIALLMAGCAGGSGSGSATGSTRLQATNEPLAIDTSASTYSLSSQSLLGGVASIVPTLTLVGTLAPPTVGGSLLQASDIAFNGTKVYVAYNTAGSNAAGGVDVIDVTIPLLPILTSEAVYSSVDINKVTVKGSYLYTAGGSNDNGATLQKISLDLFGNLTSTVSSTTLQSSADPTLPAHTGTSVIASGNFVYALGGDNGGLSILNASDLSLSSFAAVDNARDVALDSSGTGLYVVTGKTASDDARLKRFDLTSNTFQSGYNIDLPNATIDAGKSTIASGSTAQVVTSGAGGVEFLCKSSGAVLSAVANPSVAGLTADLQVANAAAFGNGLVFVANGGAGVAVYAVNQPLIPSGCTGLTLSYVGIISLGSASANNVYFANGFLVVATGTGGFKIVQVTQTLLTGLLLSL